MSDPITIPARNGKATLLNAGQAVRVVNTHGDQVVDTWAFARHDLHEHLSMAHTRATLEKITPALGDSLYSNRRRALLTITEDTSPGIHDTLMAACDNPRYQLLGCTEYHDNCADNLAAGLAELSLPVLHAPSPLNLFMHIPWDNAGKLHWEAPRSKPGDSVTLLAMIDLIVVFSACPQDILPINGVKRAPTDAHFEIVDSAG